MLSIVLKVMEKILFAILDPVLSIFSDKLTRKMKKENTNNAISNVGIEETDEFNDQSVALNHFDETSNRIRYVLDSIIEYGSKNDYSYDQIAYILGYSSKTELEDIINTPRSCTFELCKSISNHFSVNEEWLCFNKNNPFDCSEHHGSDPLDYFEKIDRYDPEKIYLIRDDSKVHNIAIALKLSKYKYVIFSRMWHHSSFVGAGGKRQLESFYRLSKRLQSSNHLYIRTNGVNLSNEILNDLIAGNIPLEYLESVSTRDNPWWDDFTDVFHQYPIANSYEVMHGTEFVKAQLLVRERLNENKMKII